MSSNHNQPKKSLMQRLFSTETALCCVGIACMVYGVVNGLKEMPLFFGLCIVGGSFLLRFVRNKDWDAHWAEHDQIRKAHEERMAAEREKKKQG